MRIGVDYYPEHWEPSLWAQDAKRMKDIGVDLVRLAEFAWGRMEPREGHFDFAWLDDAIRLFAENGLDVVLCTPTNCPPLWLYEKYPETLQVGRDGRLVDPGVRGHRCYTSAVYREFVERIVLEMARHFAANPHVTAWQIDNEVDASFCCCDACADAFRGWLKKRYTSLEAVNQAYKNDVWSGQYSSWSQVRPPLGDRPLSQYNPAYTLDYHRFASQNTVDYVRFQRDLLRRHFPGTPITTNTWFCDFMPDFYDLFEDLDFCSYDNYPTTSIPKEGYYSHAFHLDLMRGVKQKPFWIMEQLSGPMGCWLPMQPTPSPGMIQGYALQALAHGADTVVHFRWRTAIGGAEMFWHGLLDHSNVPGRRFAEFAQLCQTAKTLKSVRNARTVSKVAILCGFDSEHAFKLQLQAEGMFYFQQLMAYHEALSRFGVNVDIVDQNASLDAYQVVVAPTLYVRSHKTIQNLHRFVQSGGVVLLTCRSGVKDENNNGIMQPLPTDYADMTQATVEEYDPLGDGIRQVEMDGQTHAVSHWCDVLDAKGTTVIARYADSFHAGKPAVTKNDYGEGHVYYVGTVGQKTFCQNLIRKVLLDAKVPFRDDLPERVEMTTRENDAGRHTFLFNNDDAAKSFSFEGEKVHLQPFEMKTWQKNLAPTR